MVISHTPDCAEYGCHDWTHRIETPTEAFTRRVGEIREQTVELRDALDKIVAESVGETFEARSYLIDARTDIGRVERDILKAERGLT